MTSHEMVRTALQISGIWIVVSAFSSIESAATVAFSATTGSFDGESLAIALVTSAVAFLLFGLAPGLWVIGRSSRWASSISPPADTAAELGPSLLFAAGCMLLGLVWLVDGTIGVAVSGLTSLSSAATSLGGEFVMWNSVIPGLIRGVLELGAGLLVLRYGRSLVNHAV